MDYKEEENVLVVLLVLLNFMFGAWVGYHGKSDPAQTSKSNNLSINWRFKITPWNITVMRCL